MTTEPQHLFAVDGETLTPTDLVRGPWDPDLQHGGAVAGALAWAARRCVATSSDRNGHDGPDGGFLLSRQTTEILRPVPAKPLRFTAAIDHPGRRSRIISSSLWHEDRLVARATTQWVRPRADTASPAGSGPVEPSPGCDVPPIRPSEPSDPGASDFVYPRPGFNCDVFELRPVDGTTETPGPGVSWARMTKQLVADEAVDPVALVTAVADLGNAVGWDYSPAGAPMVNPDLTLHLMRYPVGAWVCLESASMIGTNGAGMMETTLWDDHGKIGRVLSTLVESAMPLAAAPLAPGQQGQE